MKTFEEYYLVEMARPASSFPDPFLNNGYAEALKKFKGLGVNNANTYTIWDFMFTQLPDVLKTPEVLALKKKKSGTLQRNFVLDLVHNNIPLIDTRKWVADFNDISKIQDYLNREDRGNRHKGMLNSQRASTIKMGLHDQ